ncbi:MAG: substrate-binding domain-containing protein [Planctomycetota bacterium]
MKKATLWLLVVLMGVMMILTLTLAGCEDKKAAEAPAEAEEEAAAPKEKRHYYYVGAVMAHPYFLDTWLGIDYAKQALDVDVTVLGPNDFDMTAMSAAIEQTIAKKPAGILTLAWDSTPVPSIKKAMDAGIPVILLYTTVTDSGALCYIGLDNYQAGVDTGNELIKRGGTSGKLGIIMNAGASNTEAKKAGALAALEGTDWEVVVQAEDQANTEVAIEAAKSMFNSHPEITGILGLDSSSGTGIGRAIEELGLEDKEMTIVVHDREDVTLEYIEKGIIDATVEAKTAYAPYLAIQLLENYHDRKMENDVPISADNWDAGIRSFPQFIYVGSVIIDQDNVQHFLRENLPEY